MALALTLLNGCARVQIKDETLYFPIGSSNGAVIEHTLDTNQALLTAKDWDSLLDSQAMVCMSADAYGDLKKAYETLCSYSPNACTFETQQTMNALFNKVDSRFKNINAGDLQ